MPENPPDQTAGHLAAMINAINETRFPRRDGDGPHIVQQGAVMMTAFPAEPPKEANDG